MAQGAEPTRFPETYLPAKAFDGSHLSWQAFRWNVLAPYCIRILDEVPEERLPKEVILQADAGAKDPLRYADQVGRFRAQVPLGRGFGPSPLFPPNLLPVMDGEDRLVRCMIPKCEREAHPSRAQGQQGSIYELPLARPGLASGFGLQAFSTTERAELPLTLSAAGTVVHYETGYVSPGVQVVCPFLSFERIKSTSEEEEEHTNNRCALNGSWGIRAVQMMYNKAYKGFIIPELPTAFSCAIDNNGATLNYHWIDHAEEYYMAPLRRFSFSDDAEFTNFFHFIDTIERWALEEHLPRIKAAIEKLSLLVSTPPPTPETEPPEPRGRTDPASSDAIMKALKTTFSNVPWRIDEDDRTPMPLSAMKSPLRTRISAFDFTNVSITHKTTVADYAAQRGRRSERGNENPTSPIVSSPLSPNFGKRPPISLNNKPTVPLIRLPASPKDRQNSPSSPSAPQLHAQLLALASEVQTLRKEIEMLKSSLPSTPCSDTPSSIANTPISTEPGEHGLTPILEECSAYLQDEEDVVSTKGTPVASIPPKKEETTVNITEVSPLTTPTQVSYNAEKEKETDDAPPTVEDLGRVLADLGKHARRQLARLTFWQIATSVYLTVLIARLFVSERQRLALYDLIFP